ITSSTNVPLTLTNTAAGDSLLVNDEAADTSPFVIDQFGNVGVGTTAPGAKVEIAQSTTPELRLNWSTNTSYGLLRFVEGATEIGTFQAIGTNFATADRRNDFEFNAATGDISFWPGNAQSVTFKSGGNVGIGDTTPTAKLEVAGNIIATSFIDRDSTSYYVNPGSTAYAGLFAGNVGIGTTGPVSSLMVAGTTVDSTPDTTQALHMGIWNNYAVMEMYGTAGAFIEFSDTSGADYGAGMGYDVLADDRLDFYGASAGYVFDGGNMRIDSDDASTGYVLCTTTHTGSDEWIKSCDAAGDIAEHYNGNGSLKPGDIAGNSETESVYLEKISSAYSPNMLGIISTSPVIKFGTGTGGDILLALTGRVPVKVLAANLNEPILKNDKITSSQVSGIGMKAAKAGPTVAKALESTENWNSQVCPSVNSIESITWPEDDGNNPLKPCFRLPNGTYVGKIMVFLNVSWYDPDVFLTSAGELKIIDENINSSDFLVAANSTSQVQNSKIKMQNYSEKLKIIKAETGEVLERIITGSDGIFARVKTGFIESTNFVADTVLATKAGFDIVKTGALEAISAKINDLTVNNLKVTTKLISPLVETDNLIAKVMETDLIKPLSDRDLILQIENSKTANQTESTRFKIVDENQNELFAVDTKGNASVSGQLTAESATISGELTADTGRFKKLYAQDIDGLDDKLKTAYAEASQSGGIVNNYYYESASASESDSSTSELSLGLSEDPEASLSALASTISNQQSPINNYDYLDVSSLDADSGIFNEFLAVLGQAVITNLNITNILTINDNMSITNNSIGTVGCSPVSTGNESNTPSCDQLYIQPSGLGGINMLAGKFVITENGDVTISGNLFVSGSVNSETVATDELKTQSLFAKLLKPLPGEDLAVQLSSETSTSGILNTKYKILNTEGSEVASIDASGSAVFRKLNIATANEATISSEIIDQVNTNATAGKAILPALKTQIIIPNQNITKQSLIYITPTSDTDNKVLYIRNKKDGKDGYFTVSLDKAVLFDIEFNWWIIN
ncbi:MAG TPA: hypothetical protein VMW41_00040, partial [Candidatus Bathyarchaeia archaeon]|nr:hypothetical protein [Candidatus Bathyarchaeia archaeon]